jgi:hypothetical protein
MDESSELGFSWIILKAVDTLKLNATLLVCFKVKMKGQSLGVLCLTRNDLKEYAVFEV